MSREDTLAAEVTKLRAALTSIATGCAIGEQFFKERLGPRNYPTWYAVNVLQEHLACSASTAQRALGETRA